MVSPASHYDLVVVGSGGGGLAAALTAHEAGASVAILEKGARVGGSTALSGGVFWVPNNPLMARDGVPDSFDAARRYLDAAVTDSGPATADERQNAFLHAAPRMIAFLRGLGMRFRRPRSWPDYHDDLPGGSAATRTLMVENFNMKDLGDWEDRLLTYDPMQGVPLGTDEFPVLFTAKRTLAGKLVGLKVAWRLLLNRLPGRRMIANGAAIQASMLKLVLDRRIPIFPETPVEELIVEDGRVTGVVASHQGQRITITAGRGVLLGAGGFARNLEMRRRYHRDPANITRTNANAGDTGEIMQMAIDLGAALDGMDSAIWLLTSHNLDGSYPRTQYRADGKPYPALHHLDLSLPHVIVVDQDGRRVFNESASYVEVGEKLVERQAQTGRAVPCWAILDARNRERYPWGAAPPGSTPKEWLETGFMRKADTIDALARDCGIDPAGLAETVERFNRFARNGHDEDFNRGGKAFDRAHGDPSNKPNPNLGAIDKAPFLACPVYPGDVGTAGGLVTDGVARVLKADGSVIDGLYAFGNIAASPFGHCYPGAGASIAATFTFGWIAALHALGRDEEVSRAIAP